MLDGTLLKEKENQVLDFLFIGEDQSEAVI